VAQAQQTGKIPRIGFVSGQGDPKTPGPLVEGFRQGLRDLGYIEGKNILVEYRYTVEAGLNRVPGLVTELVQLKVDVLVATSTVTIRAAKQATKAIPIVIASPTDPVAAGFVDSLARPGGNITGVVRLTRELSGKRLELLKEAVPRISRVGVLWDGNAPGPAIAFKEYEASARRLKLEFQSLEVRGPNPDLDGAFQAAVKARASALIVVRNSTVDRHSKSIVDFTLKNRLPSVWEGSEFIEAGGLMSYSSDDPANYRRVAAYVDKILKGAKPADLPIEQPTKFELVINLKTAKQIGVTIPQSMLYRADKVIK
jgi:putative ABC transport system substrate-binding protein